VTPRLPARLAALLAVEEALVASTVAPVLADLEARLGTCGCCGRPFIAKARRPVAYCGPRCRWRAGARRVRAQEANMRGLSALDPATCADMH
jgi:hypothetical protein